MRFTPILISLTSAALSLGGMAAAPAYAGPSVGAVATSRPVTDPGPTPYVFDIAKATVKNTTFRTAAWTADDLQVTLMSIPVNGEVGLEMHPNIDQFLRVERGTATVMMGTADELAYVRTAAAGDAILIPSGTWHNIVNTGTEPLKLYSLYGPAAHPQGTVHETAADAPHEGTTPTPHVGSWAELTPFTADPGAVPYVFDVEAATEANPNFRTAAWTADTLQLTLMNIQGGGDVGLEMHPNVDQFLRVESGTAKVYTGTSTDSLRLLAVAHAGDAILIPSGTWHNIVNLHTNKALKLYSLYGPQQHPQGTIHVTKPVE